MPTKPAPTDWLRTAGWSALLFALGMALGSYLSRG